MVQQNFKNIVIHEKTYEDLKKLGGITQSFNDVICELMKKAAIQEEKVQQ